VGDALQEVEDGANGEGVGLEGGQFSEDDLGGDVVGRACDAVAFAAFL
jgi:hypothetical protein